MNFNVALGKVADDLDVGDFLVRLVPDADFTTAPPNYASSRNTIAPAQVVQFDGSTIMSLNVGQTLNLGISHVSFPTPTMNVIIFTWFMTAELISSPFDTPCVPIGWEC